jgi:hypothetical protein
MRVLFILDKWCAGLRHYGISEWETNLWKSLKTTGLAKVTTFHFDAYSQLMLKPADPILLSLCEKNRPDFICLVIYKKPGFDLTVPTFETLAILNHKMKIPVMSVWGDLQNESIVEDLLPYTNFNVYTAAHSVVDTISDQSTFHYTWVPKDESVFYNQGMSRIIPLLYAGSSRQERTDIIEFIKDNGIDIMVTGGERQEHLKTRVYASLLNQAQINLSFSRAGDPPIHVVNARAFETMLCGAMLLEQYSTELELFYKPFVDYVPYSGTSDIIDKIQFYQKHADARLAIAKNGHDKTKRLYSAKRFWKMVITKMMEVDLES